VTTASIALITAILIYISILSMLSGEKKVRHFGTFIKGFAFSLSFLILTIVLNVLKNNYAFIIKFPSFSFFGLLTIPNFTIPDNIIFLLGVSFFALGMLTTTYYILGYHKQYEKEKERFEIVKRTIEEIKKQKTKICPTCGETVNKIAKVCRYCGYRFKGKKKPI